MRVSVITPFIGKPAAQVSGREGHCPRTVAVWTSGVLGNAQEKLPPPQRDPVLSARKGTCGSQLSQQKLLMLRDLCRCTRVYNMCTHTFGLCSFGFDPTCTNSAWTEAAVPSWGQCGPPGTCGSIRDILLVRT